MLYEVITYRVEVPNEINPRISKIADRLLERGNFSIKSFKNKRELKPYLYKIFDVLNEAFAPLHGVITSYSIHYTKLYDFVT